MKTTTFCQEVESGVTQQQVDERVQELKTFGGAINAYSKAVGLKRYIYSVYEVFDEPIEDEMMNPERASTALDAASPATAEGAVTDTGVLLTDEDYRRAAVILGCEAAAIRAVADVESGGRGGFLSDGRPKILFESHLFSRLTGGQYDATHPDISTAKWTRNYVGGAGEHKRLERAMQLDHEAALKSASWGKFQILGLNHEVVGSRTVDEFVEAQKRSEKEHLDAFVNFILSNDLTDQLRDRHWAGFALKYNGPGYATNNYDQKMAAAYARYA